MRCKSLRFNLVRGEWQRCSRQQDPFSNQHSAWAASPARGRESWGGMMAQARLLKGQRPLFTNREWLCAMVML